MTSNVFDIGNSPRLAWHTIRPYMLVKMSVLDTDGDDGAGLVRCKSCSDQHCSAGWCTDNWGCSGALAHAMLD